MFAVLAGVALLLTLAGIPRSRPADAGTGSGSGQPGGLRVMSLNIHHGRDLRGRSNLGRITGLIQETGADLIGLQEADARLPRTLFEDQPDVLARSLKLTQVFTASIGTSRVGYGNALLSRHPIEAFTKITLPGQGEPRSALIARVLLPGNRPVIAAVTHLGLSRSDRFKQAQVLAARLRAEALAGPYPVILMGDLNAEPGSPELEPLKGFLDDAHAAGGQPTFGEGSRPDFILTSPELTVRSAWIPPGGGSDHLAVAAEIYP